MLKASLQFGTVEAGAGKPLNVQSRQSSGYVPPLKGTTGLNPSLHLKKDAELPAVKRVNDSVPVAFGVVAKENGKFHGPGPVTSLSSSVKVLEIENRSLASSNVLQNEDNASNYSRGSMFDVLDGERSGEVDQVGPIKDSSVVMREKDVKNESNGPVKSLLPRGIINPGNLCFLNATLQALLACSPFVRLLEELRHHCIPKVLPSCICDLLIVLYSTF